MLRRHALLYLVLALAAAILGFPGPAQAAPGFQVQVSGLPGRFTAGADARTVTVVASTDRRNCQKVRWSLLLRVDGFSPRQVRVDRIEDSGSFPVSVQTQGATTRITDVELDPGQLCRGSTVTARYRVAVAAEAADGRVTFEVGVFDVRQQLLTQASATRSVVDATPPESDEPDPPLSDQPDDADADDDDADADADAEQADEAPAEISPTDPAGPGGVTAVPASSSRSTTSVVGAGLILGALLIFAGVGLLLRMRLQARHKRRLQSTDQAYSA